MRSNPHLIGLAAVALLSSAAPARAEVQYVHLTTCVAGVTGECASLQELYSAASRFLTTEAPPLNTLGPSIIIVSSNKYPLSATFTVTTYCPSRGGCKHALTYRTPQLTSDKVADTLAAAKLDNQVAAARATMVRPINIPAEYGGGLNFQEELVGAYVNTVLISQLKSGTDFWHGITHMPNFIYFVFKDKRDGKLYKIFTRELITLVFADGSTVQAEFNPTQSVQFRVLVETARKANGDPYVFTPGPAKAGLASRWIPRAVEIDGRYLMLGSGCRVSGGQVCTIDGGIAHCAISRAFFGC